MSRRNKRVFSVQAMKRFLKARGAASVGAAAAEKLATLLEEYAWEVRRRAVKQALFKGRRRIKEEDVEKMPERLTP